MNRSLILKHLILIATRLVRLREQNTGREALPLRPAPVLDEVLDGTYLVFDVEVNAALGWLRGVAAALTWSDDLGELFIAADIRPEDIAAIERGEYADPRELPGAADKVYTEIKAALETVLRAKFAHMDTLIIRSAETPLVDELARNAAQRVVATLGLG